MEAPKTRASWNTRDLVLVGGGVLGFGVYCDDWRGFDESRHSSNESNARLSMFNRVLQAHVADDVGVVKSHIADHLIPLLDKFPMPVVGFDVKAKSDAGVSRNGILVLCIGTYSLVVQFATQFPYSLIDTLKKIFDKEETCFLGVNLDCKLGALQCSWVLTSEGIYKTGVEVDELAARVLKRMYPVKLVSAMIHLKGRLLVLPTWE